MPSQVTPIPSRAARLLALWSRHAIWLALLLATVLAWHSVRHVTGDNIKADARQNLSIAFNLAERGAFSESHLDRPAQPSNLREPLPIWVVAAYLELLEPPGQHAESVFDLVVGANAVFLKRHNAGWVFLAVLGCWVLFHALTGSHLGAFVASLLVYALFLDSPHLVNTLYTELPASALLIWSAWFLVRASVRQTWRSWLLAGVVLGLLALTKAIFLYAAAGCLLVLAGVQLTGPGGARAGWPAALRVALALAIGLSVATGPWMVRNWVNFGSLEITEGRGGWVLYKRFLLNGMTDDEYKGAFAVYGPATFRDLVAGSSWAFSRDDVIRRGGRLSRLHIGASEFQDADLQAQHAGRPDLAVSYYRQTSATAVQLRDRHAALGDPFPRIQADHDMRNMAIAGIKQDLGRHLQVSLLMAWRGFWSFPTQVLLPLQPERQVPSRLIEGLNLVAGLSLYAVFVLGLLRWRPVWLAFSVVPLGLIGLYALLSQSLPRFTAPANPLILMAFLLLVHAAWRRLLARKNPSLPLVTNAA